MSWSAASFGACLLLFGDGQGLSAEETLAWQKVQPSVVLLTSGARTTGLGACIDESGRFLAHRAAVPLPVVMAKLSSGVTLTLTRESEDEVTELVLLAVANPGNRTFRPVQTAKADKPLPKSLLAVLAAGPVRADVAAADKLGVVTRQRRVLPLTELNFEAPAHQVAGALLFTLDGELIGVLNATLPQELPSIRPPVAKGIDPAPAAAGASLPALTQQYGPGGLTVAYSVAPTVLERVIDGFLSPSKKVRHPALGVFCKDAAGGGAEVQRVLPGSGAAKAGMRTGDTIVEMGGIAVKNQIDFARIMLHQTPGESLSVRVRRSGKTIELNVVVGELQ